MLHKIYDITGEYATDSESGQRVYELIYPQLLSSNSVELDFDGVGVLASAFFNFAIGQLLKDIAPEKLNELLDIRNLSPHGTSILERVIENAERYYSDNRYRQAVDAALEECAASS